MDISKALQGAIPSFTMKHQVTSVLFGDYYGTQNGDKIIPSFWGIVFYIRNIILLGLTTKKNVTQVDLVCKLILRQLFLTKLPTTSLRPRRQGRTRVHKLTSYVVIVLLLCILLRLYGDNGE